MGTEVQIQRHSPICTGLVPIKPAQKSLEWEEAKVEAIEWGTNSSSSIVTNRQFFCQTSPYGIVTKMEHSTVIHNGFGVLTEPDPHWPQLIKSAENGQKR